MHKVKSWTLFLILLIGTSLLEDFLVFTSSDGIKLFWEKILLKEFLLFISYPPTIKYNTTQQKSPPNKKLLLKTQNFPIKWRKGVLFYDGIQLHCFTSLGWWLTLITNIIQYIFSGEQVEFWKNNSFYKLSFLVLFFCENVVSYLHYFSCTNHKVQHPVKMLPIRGNYGARSKAKSKKGHIGPCFF